jgi:LmbE family N-acetylglucosaminyl deacetylase
MSKLLQKLKLIPGDKVLVFMPHPDDEAVFLAGTIHQLIKNKINVKIITTTKGEASTLRFGLKDSDNLAKARENELQKSFKILGVSDFEIWNLPDGGLIKIKTKLKEKIKEAIANFLPNLVITLEPDGIYGHPDHIALSDIVTSSITEPIRLVYATIAPYTVKPQKSHMAIRDVNPLNPNLVIRLGLFDKIIKVRCLRSHKTQFNFAKTKPGDSNFFKANKLLNFEYLVI